MLWPLAWFQHLNKMLVNELPTIFGGSMHLLQARRAHQFSRRAEKRLCGVIAVATVDLLHGGDDEHLCCMQEIQKRYKLGKYQFGQVGKFTGKQFTTLEDGSILINQAQYTKEKL